MNTKDGFIHLPHKRETGGINNSQKMKSAFFDCFYVMVPLKKRVHYTFLIPCTPIKISAIFRTLSSILVNNNNGTGREGYLLWGGNIASSKNPAEFNQLILK